MNKELNPSSREGCRQVVADGFDIRLKPGTPASVSRSPPVIAGMPSRPGNTRKITKCQAIVTRMVNNFAKADLHATKMPFDITKKVEQKAGATAPPAPLKLTPADKEDVEQIIARLAPADRGGGRGRRRSVPLTGRAGRTGADGCCNAAPRPLPNGAPVWYRGDGVAGCADAPTIEAPRMGDRLTVGQRTLTPPV